jgi:hypothetical protein
MTIVDGVGSRRRELTEALLLGYVGLNVLLHQSFVRGIGGVEGAAQPMMWIAVVGVVSYATLRRDHPAGYWLSYLTGALGLAFNGLIGSGAVGIVPTEGSGVGFVLGPVAHVAYAVVLIAATYLAARERRGPGDATPASGDRTVG